MEERQREQQLVAIRNLPAREQIEGVGREVVVRENGALGRAGGAGRVDQRGRRIAIENRPRAGREAVTEPRSRFQWSTASPGRSAICQTGTAAVNTPRVTTHFGSASATICAISRSRYRMLIGTKMAPSFKHAR